MNAYWRASAGLHTASARLPVEGELPSLDGATGWLNSPPLIPAGLRGKVVLVDFWTYTCINWLRQLPYLRAWAEKYSGHGLVVIGVHTPEFSFEHNADNVRQAMQEMRIAYPVATDNDYAVWSAFGNHYWPALYFSDSEGRIRHHHFGEGEYAHAPRTAGQARPAHQTTPRPARQQARLEDNLQRHHPGCPGSRFTFRAAENGQASVPSLVHAAARKCLERSAEPRNVTASVAPTAPDPPSIRHPS